MPKRGAIEFAKTAGRIRSRFTPVVPGASVAARCSVGTSQSSSGIPFTPAAARSSASAPDTCWPESAQRRNVDNDALLRSSIRSRCSASGLSAVRVSAASDSVSMATVAALIWRSRSGVPFSMVSSSARCSSFSSSTTANSAMRPRSFDCRSRSSRRRFCAAVTRTSFLNTSILEATLYHGVAWGAIGLCRALCYPINSPTKARQATSAAVRGGRQSPRVLST